MIPPETLCLVAGFLLLVSLIFLALLYFVLRYLKDAADPSTARHFCRLCGSPLPTAAAPCPACHETVCR